MPDTSRHKLQSFHIKQNCVKETFTNVMEVDTRTGPWTSCNTRLKNNNDLFSNNKSLQTNSRKTRNLLKSSKKMRKRAKKDKLRRAAKSRKKYKRKKTMTWNISWKSNTQQTKTRSKHNILLKKFKGSHKYQISNFSFRETLTVFVF